MTDSITGGYVDDEPEVVEVSIFPLRTSASEEPGEPRLVDIGDDDADAVFDALSSTTARRAYAAIADEPRTASDLAETLDCSLQNARYHLDNLSTAGLVTEVDTWYSSRGSEMTVYGTSDGPIVLFAGDEESGSEVRQALQTLIGGTIVVAVLGVLINWVTRPARTPDSADVFMTSASGTEAAGSGLEWVIALPGLLFAVGGVLVLLGVTGYLLWTARSSVPRSARS